MPANLRFVLLIFGLAVLTAPVSVYLIERQDQQDARSTAEALTGGSVDAGKLDLDRYGCSACHQIQVGAGIHGKVGPSLVGVAVRAQLAGRLANKPDNMILWLRHPQQVSPGTGMPDQGLSDRDARDIAAYLYTLRR